MKQIKICKRCNQEKPITEFSKSKTTKDRLQSYCKSCNKTYQKKYYKNNNTYLKNYQKEYRENNKKYHSVYKANYRAKKSNNIGFITEELWNEALKFFGYKDAYTGQPMKQISIDHIQATSKEGGNHIWNIIPVECSLNKKKYNKDFLEWYKSQPFYSEKRLNKILEYIGYMRTKYVYIDEI